MQGEMDCRRAAQESEESESQLLNSSVWRLGYGIATQSLLDRSSCREQSWTSMDPNQERGDKMSPLLGVNRINHSMDRAVDGDFIQDLSFPIRR
jgi:hypothetical protein